MLKIVHHFMQSSLGDYADLVSPSKQSDVGAAQEISRQMNYEGFLIVLIRLIWKVIAPPPTGQVAARPSLSLSSSGKRPVLSNKVGDAAELVEHAMSLLAST